MTGTHLSATFGHNIDRTPYFRARVTESIVLQKNFAVAHYAYQPAPDDDGPEPAPILRDWRGSAADAGAARDRWVEAHGDDDFLGDIEPWTHDEIGKDHLLIFRVPGSPLDLAGWMALLLGGRQPVAFVRGPSSIRPTKPSDFQRTATPPTAAGLRLDLPLLAEPA